jgi:Tat protein secretion system quality control protein TatD with DNase activity
MRSPLWCSIMLVATIKAGGAESSPATPINEFAKQYKELKESISGLPKKIEETGRTVEQNTNASTTKAQIDTLRAIVSTILGQVADNGPVSKMGQAALDFARAKLKEAQESTQFSKEQREFLIAQWKATAETTAVAVRDLEQARKELAELLRVLQSNQDFLQELEMLSNAAQTIDVLRALTRDMREISRNLQNIIQRMAVPSM